jgi:hypothetical protein
MGGYPHDPADQAPDETLDDLLRIEANADCEGPLERLKRTEYVRTYAVDRYFDGTTERFDITFEYVRSGGLSTVGLDEENALNLARFIMDALDPRDTPFSDGLDPVEIPCEDIVA